MTTPIFQKVHEASGEGMLSALELFTVPPTDLQVERTWSQEYYPIAPLVESRQLEFNVTSSSDHYIDLNKTLIEIYAKIVKSDGSALVKDVDNVTPIVNFMHTMFNQIDVHMNRKLVSKSHNLYAYKAYIQTLLNNRKSVQEEQYDTALFLKDAPDKLDKQNDAVNTNATIRRSRFAESTVHDMIGKLHIDIFNFDRFLLNNIDLKLTLTRSKDDFCLFSEKADAKYKVVITKAILHVTNVKVSPALILAHSTMLQKTTVKYPISPVDIKAFSFPSGLTHINLDNLILGSMPVRLIIGMVDSRDFIGTLKTNPFKFQHFNLNFLCLSLNGEQIPTLPYTPDFSTNQYARLYHDFLENICVWDRDRTCGIN